VLDNPYLPQPTFDVRKKNVVVHIRRGDAVAQGRTRESDELFGIVKKFQELNQDWFVTIHTDGNMNELSGLKSSGRNGNRTFIYYGNFHVLQVLSDFVYADVLVISESALSIAATWLGDPVTSRVIGPTPGADASINLEGRIRPGYETYRKAFDSISAYDSEPKRRCGSFNNPGHADYINATMDALHPRSLLRNHVADFSSQCFPAKSSFFAVGMEASGHHLLMTVPKDVYLGKGAQALSFPECGCQRAVPDANQCSIALKMGTEAWTFPKYLILIRDPTNQFLSILRRYWDPSQFSLTAMYDMWISAASQMQIFINSLIAQKVPLMVLSYEVLTDHPSAHKKPLNHFFGVDSAAMDRWIDKIRKADTYDLSDVPGFSECAWSWGRWKKDECTHDNVEIAFEYAFYRGQKKKMFCGKSRNESAHGLYNAFTWPSFMYDL
jgi:hypothetical protein